MRVALTGAFLNATLEDIDQVCGEQKLPAKLGEAATPISDFHILSQWCILHRRMSQNLVETIQAARDAYKAGAWADATDLFLRADADGPEVPR